MHFPRAISCKWCKKAVVVDGGATSRQFSRQVAISRLGAC